MRNIAKTTGADWRQYMPKVYSKRKTAPIEYRNPPLDAILIVRNRGIKLNESGGEQ